VSATYKIANVNLHGVNADLMTDLPYHIVTSFDQMSVAEGRALIESLGIKDSEWDFQMDAGGTVTDPFRIIFYFKNRADCVMFALKIKA